MEGLPTALTARKAVGSAYLIVIGAALGYWVWVRGIGVLGADVTFLSLLSPLTATVLGALVLGEWFSPMQTGGAVLILGATVAGMALSRREQRGPAVQANAAQRPGTGGQPQTR